MADRTAKPVVAQGAWKRTEAHKASRYSCAYCGKKVRDPHEFYRHRDREHD